MINLEKKEEANPLFTRSEPKIWASQQPTLLTQLCHTISSIVEEVMGSETQSAMARREASNPQNPQPEQVANQSCRHPRLDEVEENIE
ncbi:hypothetical protein BLNAU_22204 [Blattamonas nauphoetae]|uniref:Uncharacterized protein n=1 Tax=Blattamonas nauphoetae TaxID=2049346 RepID=A0ABQ9WTP6_9EUKA|nr:hypothetical protein BLNAU_22204 [Blattamonas nauphoetae]